MHFNKLGGRNLLNLIAVMSLNGCYSLEAAWWWSKICDCVILSFVSFIKEFRTMRNSVRSIMFLSKSHLSSDCVSRQHSLKQHVKLLCKSASLHLIHPPPSISPPGSLNSAVFRLCVVFSLLLEEQSNYLTWVRLPADLIAESTSGPGNSSFLTIRWRPDCTHQVSALWQPCVGRR